MDITQILSELQKKGLTQAEIGARVGCSQSAISDMANGKIGKKRPSYKIVAGLMELAKAHGISLGERRKATDRRSNKDRRSAGPRTD